MKICVIKIDVLRVIGLMSIGGRLFQPSDITILGNSSDDQDQ